VTLQLSKSGFGRKEGNGGVIRYNNGHTGFSFSVRSTSITLYNTTHAWYSYSLDVISLLLQYARIVLFLHVSITSITNSFTVQYSRRTCHHVYMCRLGHSSLVGAPPIIIQWGGVDSIYRSSQSSYHTHKYINVNWPAKKTKIDRQHPQRWQTQGETNSDKMPRPAEAHISAKHATSSTATWETVVFWCVENTCTAKHVSKKQIWSIKDPDIWVTQEML